MTTPALVAAVERALGHRATRVARTAGGDLNDAWRLELDGIGPVFVKTASDAAPGAFAAEAASLRWLAEPGALPVPEVLAVADDDGGPRFLALRWVDAGPRADAEALGRGLAALHAAGAADHGTTGPGTPSLGAGDVPPTRLGPLVLPNDPAPGWPEFYAQRRLVPLADLAEDRRALPRGARGVIDGLCARIGELCGPAEPPARLHGDLWGGNVMSGAHGSPWLIDPAAYGGHREIDLAMLRLFGGPGERCFAAYAEHSPLADGHAERIGLYQLLPLLVHAALFGGGYGARAAEVAGRY